MKIITSRVVLILIHYAIMYGIYYIQGFEFMVIAGFAFLLADNSYTHYNKDSSPE